MTLSNFRIKYLFFIVILEQILGKCFQNVTNLVDLFQNE